jgi:type II secretory pathway pseudopilin PulG
MGNGEWGMNFGKNSLWSHRFATIDPARTLATHAFAAVSFAETPAKSERLLVRNSMVSFETVYDTTSAPSFNGARIQSRRTGLTLIELLVCVVIVVVLIALFFPGVRTARGAARRMQCSNNLKQLALAALNYESKYKSLPAGWGGPARLSDSDYQPLYLAHEDPSQQLPPVGRWSAFVPLLPFLEQQQLYEQIHSEYRTPDSDTLFAAPISPWNSIQGQYKPWSTSISNLKCPADPASMRYPSSNTSSSNRVDDEHFFARTNYALSYGDCFLSSVDSVLPIASRGIFHGRVGTRLSDVSDGLSNTLLFAEIATPSSEEIPEHNPRSIHGRVVAMNTLDLSTPSACREIPIKGELPKGYNSFAKSWRGVRWCDGAPAITGFTTCLSPNSVSCSTTHEFSQGFYSVSSHHDGGVTAASVDGAVRFVSNLIDCGNANAPVAELRMDSPSPFGVWGALGTMAGNEIVAGDSQ